MPVQIREKWSRAFEGLSYLAYKIPKKLCLVISFIHIHIIHLSLLGSEYWPIAVKKVKRLTLPINRQYLLCCCDDIDWFRHYKLGLLSFIRSLYIYPRSTHWLTGSLTPTLITLLQMLGNSFYEFGKDLV